MRDFREILKRIPLVCLRAAQGTAPPCPVPNTREIAEEVDSPGDSVFDGSAIFSATCQDGGSFSSVSTCSVPSFSFAAVGRGAITASSLAGAVVTCKTVSRSGTARTSSMGAALVCFQGGQSSRLVSSLVTWQRNLSWCIQYCGNQEFPLVMSIVTQATGMVDRPHLEYCSTSCFFLTHFGDSLHHRRAVPGAVHTWKSGDYFHGPSRICFRIQCCAWSDGGEFCGGAVHRTLEPEAF